MSLLINYSGIALVGLAIGVLSGLFGTGGGFILVPVLKFIFGIPYNTAVGSSLGAIAVTAAFGTMKQYRYHHVKFKLGFLLFSGSVFGVELGARLMVYIKEAGDMNIFGHGVPIMDFTVSLCYLSLLLIAGILMYREAGKYNKTGASAPCVRDLGAYKIKLCCGPNRQDIPANTDSLNIPLVVIAGFCVGILTGLLGIGGGFIMTPALIIFFRVPAAVAVGTDLFQITLAAIYGTVTHAAKGNVDFTLVLIVLCGSIAGSQIGASLTPKLRGKQIRLYFSWFLFISALFIACQVLPGFVR